MTEILSIEQRVANLEADFEKFRNATVVDFKKLGKGVGYTAAVAIILAVAMFVGHVL